MKVGESALRTIRIARWRLALALVFIVAGFLVVTQVRNELLIRQQHLDALRAFGFPITAAKADPLVIPAYRGSYRFTFAKPTP